MHYYTVYRSCLEHYINSWKSSFLQVDRPPTTYSGSRKSVMPLFKQAVWSQNPLIMSNLKCDACKQPIFTPANSACEAPLRLVASQHWHYKESKFCSRDQMAPSLERLTGREQGLGGCNLWQAIIGGRDPWGGADISAEAPLCWTVSVQFGSTIAGDQ